MDRDVCPGLRPYPGRRVDDVREETPAPEQSDGMRFKGAGGVICLALLVYFMAERQTVVQKEQRGPCPPSQPRGMNR